MSPLINIGYCLITQYISASIDKDTLVVSYKTESDDNQMWSLNVQATWDEPEGNSMYIKCNRLS